jgi:hypothetical protein
MLEVMEIMGMNPEADKHPSMGYSFQSPLRGINSDFDRTKYSGTSPGPNIPGQAPDPRYRSKQRGITLRLRRDCSTTHFRNRNARLTKKWLRYYLDS